jgi:hypothetical protein
MSIAPPGLNGVINRTGLLGYSLCAAAAAQKKIAASALALRDEIGIGAPRRIGLANGHQAAQEIVSTIGGPVQNRQVAQLPIIDNHSHLLPMRLRSDLARSRAVVCSVVGICGDAWFLALLGETVMTVVESTDF